MSLPAGDRTQRPRGLAASTAAMAVMNLTGFLFLNESEWPVGVSVALLALFIGGGYVALWYFWRGRNWARWLVMVTSGVALLNLLLLLMPVSTIVLGVIVIEAVLGGFLLYWLNTRAVRAFFVGERPVPPAPQAGSPGPAGIGGWLALLIVGLIGLRPLLGAGLIIADHTAAERETPVVVGVPAWSNFKAATWSGFFATAAISIYAGWGLLKGRNRSVVRRAIGALWLAGPVGQVLVMIVVPLLTLGAFENSDINRFIRASEWPLIRSTIVASVWTAYLMKSGRVRSTYGESEAV